MPDCTPLATLYSTVEAGPHPGAAMRTVGSVVAELLAANGVRVVFGIPGTHNLEIYRGLGVTGIEHVTPRHEQGAAYAADGYARSSNRPGVVVTTSGPGLLNAAAGLATSYADSIPLLVISPGPARGRDRLDSGWLHEVKDQRAALENIVSRSIRCGDPQQVATAIHSTFARWRVERSRPVHIEIPVDLLEEPWAGTPAPPMPALFAGTHPPSITTAAHILNSAQRPMLLVGGGGSDAPDEIRLTAEHLGAPVITTTAGKGAIDEYHPLAGGVAVPYAEDVIRDADVLLVVGSELAEADLETDAITSARIIRIDLDAAQLCKPVTPVAALLGDAAAVLAPIRAQLTTAPRTGAAEWAAAIRSRVRAAGKPEFSALHEALAACLPATTIIAGDSSQVIYRGAVLQLPLRQPRSMLYPNGFSTLGYGLPAAIGAKLANPDRPVLGLFGDGAFLFSVQELATAAEQQLDITLLIVDNSGYGEIRDQMIARSIPPLGVNLTHGLVDIAQAFGWSATRAHTLDDAVLLVEQGMAHHGPAVVVASPEALDARP